MSVLFFSALLPIGAATLVHLIGTVLVSRARRRALSPSAAGSAPVRWIARGFEHVMAPCATLVWIVAVHSALATILPSLPEGFRTLGAVVALDALRRIALAATVVWLVVRAARVIERALVSVAARTASDWDDALLPIAGRAIRVLLPIAATVIALQLLPVPADVRTTLRTGGTVVLIGAVAFLLYQCIAAIAALVLARYQLDVQDNLEARSIHTQVLVLKRIATSVLAIFTAGSMLMVFEPVRQFGTSILASAGIAGIILGLAAQRSIATMLAGLQLALTQPIRIDDVVIVDNEWGRIEDITLTYVTVRIWDQRRLIVPITYFIERPFQNWTRRSADILGTVLLYVDYSAPIDALRAELERIVRASPYWDGKVVSMQVTDAREQTLEVRALVSAADASLAWDLRCEVREQLVAFLKRTYPAALPKIRAEVYTPAAAPAGSATGAPAALL